MNLSSSNSIRQQEQGDFTVKVFAWVALAFGITTIGVYTAPIVFANFAMPAWGLYVIYAVAMGMAFTSHRWSMMAKPMNLFMFFFFAYIMGFMLFPLISYTAGIPGGGMLLGKAFGATTLMTLAAGIYAKTTDRDLSGIGGFLSMAIIGIIIVSIAQIFLPYNNTVELFVSGFGVVIFSALIAYNIQMLQHYSHDRAMDAAIGLYISIYNLFTSALRLLLAFGSSD